MLSFAPEKDGRGKILGQVNGIYKVVEDNGSYTQEKCVMTLAPYKNGARQIDCSIPGHDGAPLRFNEVRKIMSSMPSSLVVVVRFKDPFAFGPKAGQVLDSTIGSIDIDQRYGIFLRPNEEHAPKVVVLEEEDPPKKYFVELYRCYDDGTLSDFEHDAQELKHFYPDVGLDRFFNSRAEATRMAKKASKMLDGYFSDPIDVSDGLTHILAIVRHGDEYESDVIECFIDGKTNAEISIEKQLAANEQEKQEEPEEDYYVWLARD